MRPTDSQIKNSLQLTLKWLKANNTERNKYLNTAELCISCYLALYPFFRKHKDISDFIEKEFNVIRDAKTPETTLETK